MGSAFSGIELGKRGLFTNTEAMQTVGHNLANAGTEGYSRQRVEMKATDPLYDPALNREERPGQLGQGVDTESITRVRDDLLESRIVSSGGGEGYWAARDKYVLMLEQIHNEPTELSIRNRMDKFWDSWQDLSQNPQDLSVRKAVLERGEGLVDSIHLKYKNLHDVALMVNDDIRNTVGEVNQYTKDIATLNVQIQKVKAMGDNPNDLMDRRDLLVDKLSALVPITVENKRDPKEFQIHMGGIHLVQGKIATPMELQGDANNEGYWKIVRPDTKEDMRIPGGKLGALIELRDVDTKKEIQNLDLMTMHFSDLVNEVHRAGFGQGGDTGLDFFTQQPAVLNVDGSYDKNGDGTLDSTYVFRMDGKNKLNPQEMIGLAGTMTLPGPKGNIQVSYKAADTVQDVVNRINTSGAEVSARLDRENRLSLKAVPGADSNNPDFVIRHVEDSGQFLTGYSGLLSRSGVAGAFDWNTPQAVTSLATAAAPEEGARFAVAPLAHPSAWVQVSENLTADPTKIAAGLGQGGKPAEMGDGSGALAMASIRNTTVMIGQSKTFDDYFAQTVAEVGLKGETAKISLDTQEKIMKDLRDTRESLSGVNMDEEMSNMLKFQHGYNATSRFITEWSDMLDTIIKRMGV